MVAQNVERTVARANHAQHVKSLPVSQTLRRAHKNGEAPLANAAGSRCPLCDAFAPECDGVLIY